MSNVLLITVGKFSVDGFCIHLHINLRDTIASIRCRIVSIGSSTLLLCIQNVCFVVQLSLFRILFFKSIIILCRNDTKKILKSCHWLEWSDTLRPQPFKNEAMS
jgi:hypothetical protein